MNSSSNVRISAINTVAGNGVLAEKSLKAGELILVLERPLVAVLDTKLLPNTCSFCFREKTAAHGAPMSADIDPINIKACSGCKTLRYCSKQCQTASWKLYHKNECKLLEKLAVRGILPTPARAVLQLLQTGNALQDLDSHLDDIARAGGERFETLQILSMGIFNYSGTKLGLDYVQQCFAVLQTNSFTLTSAVFDPLGVVVDPYAAKFNHSCVPNAFVVFDGARMSLRSLKSIAKDEEVFISYIDVTNPYFHRQNELRKRYFFSCKCSKCKLGPTLKEDRFAKDVNSLPHGWDRNMMPRRNMLIGNDEDDQTDFAGSDEVSATLGSIQKLAFEKLELASKSASSSQTTGNASEASATIQTLKEGMQSCIHTKLWPDCRQPLPALRQQLFVELLTPAFDGLSWSFAFRQGLKLYFDIHPVLFPETFHPGRIIHKWTMANLALMLADPQTRVAEGFEKVDFGVVIIGLLMEVQDNVKESHGTESIFAATIRRKFEEVTVDMTRGDKAYLNNIKERIRDQWAVLRELIRSETLDSWMLYV